MIDELGVDESVVVIVEHHVGPVEVEHRDIPQVDDAVGIPIDEVTVVVQVVERGLIEGAEYQTQDTVDNRSSGVGVPTSWNHGAIPYHGSGTMNACGRRTCTAPAVVCIVPAKLIAVVVSVVVIAMVVVVAMVATKLAVVITMMSVSTGAAVIAVTVAVVSMTVIVKVAAAVIAVSALVSLVVATRPVVAIVAAGAAVASLVVATRIHGGSGSGAAGDR